MSDTIANGMERLVVTVQELSMARDMETVMCIVRTVARELTGADGATFILRENDLCFYADENAISPLWKGQRFPMQACISGWAMIHKQPVMIEDIYADDRIPVNAYKPTFVRSLLMVPIRTIDPVGAIGNYWAHKHLATTEEVKLLQALADITAVTIENVKVYNELEQRVHQRTQQLEKMNEELEAFSYSLSHDLRSPLRSVNLFMDLFKKKYESELDDEGKRLINGVTRKADEMDQLITDLFAFFGTRTNELIKKTVEMKDMVESICKEYSEQKENGKVQFVVNDLHDTKADNASIKQVWTNLIGNAVKYSRNRENPVIEIGSNETNNHIEYYIKDNGAGFDMQYYSKLFHVFQRLHTKDEFEGTGLGLAIVEKIVSNHGGSVWAQSQVDKGAMFYFSLPKE